MFGLGLSGRWARIIVILAIGMTGANIGFVSPALSQEQSENVVGLALLQRLRGLGNAEPAALVAEAQRFLQENRNNPKLKRSLASNIYFDTARIQGSPLKDYDGALATLNEALVIYADDPEFYKFYIAKSSILFSAGRAEEAEALLAAQWPTMVETRATTALSALTKYVPVLNKLNKSAEALELTRNLVQRHPALAGDLNFAKLMTDQLLAKGQADEALKWGKLYFMLTPYNEKSYQEATSLLAHLWAARYGNPAKTQELLAAMQDPLQPNPLREIPLPIFDRDNVQKQLAAAVNPQERVTLLLGIGDTRSGMIEAQRIALGAPTSPEAVLEVCRVFKAHDLDMERANAFLDVFNESTGVNPVTGFLQAQ